MIGKVKEKWRVARDIEENYVFLVFWIFGFGFSETGFLCVALAVLELTL